jgi:hypothetical protein
MAWDPVSGKKRWEVRSKAPHWSGVLSTASGVVFVGAQTGEFKAIDAADGRQLWSFQTGSGITGLPITWERNGRQYVTVTSGAATVYGALAGDPELANVPAGSSLWTFALMPYARPQIRSRVASSVGGYRPRIERPSSTFSCTKSSKAVISTASAAIRRRWPPGSRPRLRRRRPRCRPATPARRRSRSARRCRSPGAASGWSARSAAGGRRETAARDLGAVAEAAVGDDAGHAALHQPADQDAAGRRGAGVLAAVDHEHRAGRALFHRLALRVARSLKTVIGFRSSRAGM